MGIFETSILLEEIVGDKEISPMQKQLITDPVYGKRAKFLFDKGFDINTIQKSINIDKKHNMKNKAVVWIANQLKKYQGPEFRHNNVDIGENSDEWGLIFDWMRATNPDIMNLTFESALNRSAEWHNEAPTLDTHTKSQMIMKYETNDVIFKGNGFKIVELKTRRDLDVEGQILELCTAEGRSCGHYFGKMKSGTRFFSLRDNKNEPHVLCEFEHPQFLQIQAHGNTVPIDKYKQQLYQWLSTEAPRDSELNDVVLDRATPDSIKEEIYKQIEQKIIEDLEKEQ